MKIEKLLTQEKFGWMIKKKAIRNFGRKVEKFFCEHVFGTCPTLKKLKWRPCSRSSLKQNWCWNSSYADGTTHFCSKLMYLVTLTIPLTMSNSTTSHAAPDHDFRICRHNGLNSSPGNLLTYVWAFCQPGRKCFWEKRMSIAEHYPLPNLTAPTGVLQCPQDSLVPLDIISH